MRRIYFITIESSILLSFVECSPTRLKTIEGYSKTEKKTANKKITALYTQRRRHEVGEDDGWFTSERRRRRLVPTLGGGGGGCTPAAACWDSI